MESLRPVGYRWLEGGKVQDGVDASGQMVFIPIDTEGKRQHWGFLSQEVKSAMEDAGVDSGAWILANKDDPESTQSLRYEELIAPLVKAVQEVSARVKALEQPARLS